MSRQVWRVLPDGNAWAVALPTGAKVNGFDLKADAEAFAIEEARAAHEHGVETQVVIHKRNGRIEEERTYGHDPERYEG